MNFRHVLKNAYGGLEANRVRSGLTILGIVIGIASIMLIVSLGRGAEALILNQLSGFGADMIVIRPGKEPTGPSDIAGTLFADSLVRKDVEALKRASNVPGLVSVSPILIVPSSVSYRGETYRPEIFGWSAEFLGNMFNIFPEEGVLFGEAEDRQRATIAVIGSKVKEELFGESDALGQVIKIRGRAFRVVGIFPPHGQVAFFNIDNVVLIPPTTAQLYLLGVDYYHEVIVRAESPEAVPRIVEDIEITLREQHGITDPDKDDFFIVTQEGIVNQISSILGALTILLSGVVAISLVVAGIGVMNIMLVSVAERTKEIGLRKAVGATPRDILKQFLFEAILLTIAGGAIGVALGAALSFLISIGISQALDVDWPFQFSVSAALLGLGVAGLVGLIFGVYPAKKASQKSPIEALRYE